LVRPLAENQSAIPFRRAGVDNVTARQGPSSLTEFARYGSVTATALQAIFAQWAFLPR